MAGITADQLTADLKGLMEQQFQLVKTTAENDLDTSTAAKGSQSNQQAKNI